MAGAIELLSQIVRNRSVLLILLGLAMELLGLAGGVTYHSWFPIQELWARGALCVLAVVPFFTGIRSRPAVESDIDRKEYDIKITSPRLNEEVSVGDVEGKMKRRLPEGYSLWIFREYLNERQFAPIGKAEIHDDLTWAAYKCDIAGNAARGTRRGVSANIVGKHGEALIAFHNKALNQSPIPPIDLGTPDITQCDKVIVVCEGR
jgi:hypothetical protein